MIKDTKHEGQASTIPKTLAETTPPISPGHDYTWALFQQMMEVQRTLGELNRAVTILTDKSEKHGDKLDKISHKVFAAQVVFYVIVGILTAASGIIVFFLNKFWGAIIPLLQAKPHP